MYAYNVLLTNTCKMYEINILYIIIIIYNATIHMYYTILYFHILLRFANITQFYSTNEIICIQDGPSNIECKSVIRMILSSNFIENGMIGITF